MSRQLAGLAVTTALGLGALVAPAAQAEPTPAAAPAAAPFLTGLTVHPEWGAVAVASGKLRKGCKSYSYSYSLSPPPGDWSVEVFISGPDGEALWSGNLLIGSDPLAGSDQFTFCRSSTRSGTFLIEAKLTVQNGAGEANYQEGQLPQTTFQLKALKKKRHHHHH